ncbi:MAG: DUF2809 domain-containing protein [Myxococcota bacterium]
MSTGSRGLSAALAVGWFAVGFCVWAFTTGWIRGSIGDLAVVAFIAHLVGVVKPVPVVWRAGGALGFATVVECVQLLKLVGPGDPEWMHILLGSTFDPMDLVHYALSAGLAVAGELAGLRLLASRA